MLTEIVRKCEKKCANRFELVVLTSERSRQLLGGARPTVDNPDRERTPKVAMREIDAGNLIRDGEDWVVVRPDLADLFTEPTVDEKLVPEAPEAESASAEAAE